MMSRRTEERGALGTAALLAALGVALSPAAGGAEEQRCRELGSACYCSEPLDNADRYVGVHDPTDSSTKACGVYDAATPGRGEADPPVALPSGASVGHVLAIDRDTGLGKLLVWPEPASLDLTNRTFCVRSYRNYGKDHALPGNFKIARAGSMKGNVAWQASWSVDKGAAAQPDVTWTASLGEGAAVDCVLGTAGPALQFSDCQSHWCRFEICSDHDAASGELRVRARWSQVGGPKQSESYLGAPGQWGPDCEPERSPTAILVGSVVLAEFASVCCPETRGGSIYLSHVMASLRSFDPTFWIGPALEVEAAPASGR